MAGKKGTTRRTQKKLEYHGMTGTPERGVWASMIGRCTIPSHTNWKYYGERGVSVCQRWRDSLLAFLEDMGPCPAGHSIDRVNNDGNYSCGHCEECLSKGWTANCRWETQKRQVRNRRNNVMLTWNGKTQAAPDWSDETGIPTRLLVQRVNILGWSDEKALTTPAAKCERQVESEYEFDGRSQSLAAWSRESGIGAGTLAFRLKHGWSFEQAITTPVQHTTYEYCGESLPLQVIERREGFTRNTLQSRMRKGMTFTEALESARQRKHGCRQQ